MSPIYDANRAQANLQAYLDDLAIHDPDEYAALWEPLEDNTQRSEQMTDNTPNTSQPTPGIPTRTNFRDWNRSVNHQSGGSNIPPRPIVSRTDSGVELGSIDLSSLSGAAISMEEARQAIQALTQNLSRSASPIVTQPVRWGRADVYSESGKHLGTGEFEVSGYDEPKDHHIVNPDGSLELVSRSEFKRWAKDTLEYQYYAGNTGAYRYVFAASTHFEVIAVEPGQPHTHRRCVGEFLVRTHLNKGVSACVDTPIQKKQVRAHGQAVMGRAGVALYLPNPASFSGFVGGGYVAVNDYNSLASRYLLAKDKVQFLSQFTQLSDYHRLHRSMVREVVTTFRKVIKKSKDEFGNQLKLKCTHSVFSPPDRPLTGQEYQNAVCDSCGKLDRVSDSQQRFKQRRELARAIAEHEATQAAQQIRPMF